MTRLRVSSASNWRSGIRSLSSIAWTVWILLAVPGCSNNPEVPVAEIQEHCRVVIEVLEEYEREHGKYPSSLSELPIDESAYSLAQFPAIYEGKLEYQVEIQLGFYQLSFFYFYEDDSGTKWPWVHSYDSETREWVEEGMYFESFHVTVARRAGKEYHTTKSIAYLDLAVRRMLIFVNIGIRYAFPGFSADYLFSVLGKGDLTREKFGNETYSWRTYWGKDKREGYSFLIRSYRREGFDKPFDGVCRVYRLTQSGKQKERIWPRPVD